MLDNKYDYAAIVTLEAAENLFEQGIAVVVTDGKYIELEDDRKDE